MAADPRRSSPAVQRNREPLLAVLRTVLPPAGIVLEVASGTGEHVAWFAHQLPQLIWQPSDPSVEARASIEGWAAGDPAPNLRAPLALDAAAADWPIDRADAILCVNMVHISPWPATLGLVHGSARLLLPGAPLILYGPFVQAGVTTAPSNLAFDIDLRTRNSAWGLRALDDVVTAARAERLVLERTVEMPANNLTLIFRR